MNKGMVALITGITLGGTAMYLLDPERGRRRRALMRDKALSTAKTTTETVGKTSRDVANRTTGLVAATGGLVSATTSLFGHTQSHNGDVLTERVRSKLGRAIAHPGTITVHAEKGRVTLSGPVLRREVKRLLDTVSSVRGVKEIENNLEIHDAPEDIPGIQWEGRERPSRFELPQRNWSPVARVLAGLAGAFLVVYGLRRKNVFGSLLGTAGVGMLARGITDLRTREMPGVGAGRWVVEVEKAININAPVERVFEVWSNYENFPYFMSNVRDVHKTSATMSHWKVSGPVGAPIEWDAITTEYVPNKVLAWKTAANSPVAHSGRIYFSQNPSGSTRVDVKLSYNPIAGGLGHIVASLLGSDPKSRMDEDLVRMKSFIETGKVPAGSALARN